MNRWDVGSDSSGKQGEIQGVYHYNSVVLIRKESGETKNTLISLISACALTFNTSTHTCVVSMHFKNTSLKHRKKNKL